MMIRGLPMENLWMQKRRRDLAGTVAFRTRWSTRSSPSAVRHGCDRRQEGHCRDDDRCHRSTGEQLDDVNIRYQITLPDRGHETTSGLLSYTL